MNDDALGGPNPWSEPDAAAEHIGDALQPAPKQCPKCGYTNRARDPYCAYCLSEFVGALAPAALHAAAEEAERVRRRAALRVNAFAGGALQHFMDDVLFPGIILLMAIVSVACAGKRGNWGRSSECSELRTSETFVASKECVK